MEQNFTQKEQKFIQVEENLHRQNRMEQYYETNYLSYGAKFYTNKTKNCTSEAKPHRSILEQYHSLS